MDRDPRAREPPEKKKRSKKARLYPFVLNDLVLALLASVNFAGVRKKMSFFSRQFKL